MSEYQEVIDRLNARDKEERMAALGELKAAVDAGKLPKVPRLGECDNHIHSQFSFSPYSPAMIAWKAYETGLDTCGIVDHESVGGILEFQEACRMVGVVPTAGFELRMHMDNTPLAGRKLNNPDQLSVGYFPVHGLPVCSIDQVDAYLQPIRKARESRNRRMVEKINGIVGAHGMQLDFDRDVIPVSRWEQRGNITERHLLFATAQMFIRACGKGQGLLDFLTEKMQIKVPEANRAYLLDVESPIYEFDLTNLLKGFFSELMYIDATHEETPDIREAIPYLTSLGCIPTYTYVGDIAGDSVTGDKKTQKFEDEILDELFALLHEVGVRAFSYAPTRNTAAQVARVRALCRKYGMLEVLGEDINQPRQNFVMKHASEEDRQFFNDATWAIIGHEKLADQDLSDSIISDKAAARFPDLSERIQYYKEAALRD